MSISGSAIGASFGKEKSRTGTKDTTSTLNTDVVMDTSENRRDDYEDENQSIKIVKPDKYNGNCRKLEPWFLQLAI